MGFPQVIATFHVIYDVIGLPGNLLVILTIILESRFHVMRYILLASLALSDFLLLILVNSFRIGSTAQQHGCTAKQCAISTRSLQDIFTSTRFFTW